MKEMNLLNFHTISMRDSTLHLFIHGFFTTSYQKSINKDMPHVSQLYSTTILFHGTVQSHSA